LVFVDRIERHDVVNAVMLAAVLLLLGFGIVTALNDLFNTVDEGLVNSAKDPLQSSQADPAGASATSATISADDTTSLPAARAPGEVKVRVGNGARRPGVAGAGTEALEKAGYVMLPPKNGPTMDDSVVYYTTGYAAEAAQIATVLKLEPTRIAPIPDDPGIPVDDAQVVAILGVTSDF
jgi:hypothetical protein